MLVMCAPHDLGFELEHVRTDVSNATTAETLGQTLFGKQLFGCRCGTSIGLIQPYCRRYGRPHVAFESPLEFSGNIPT